MVKFIVNPHAGKGDTRKHWDEIRLRIERLGIESDWTVTEHPDQARPAIADALARGCRSVYVVGGDGAINGAVHCLAGTPAALGIIPTGSGNDFAKMLGITSVDAGIETLTRGSRKPIDLGRVGDRYFVNIIGIGFDALVAHLVRKNRLRGQLGYFASVLSALAGYHPPRFTLATDAGSFDGRAFSVSVGNGRFHGSLFRLTPDAIIDDGILDICIIGKVPVPKFLFNIPKAIKGTHGSIREIVMLKTKSLSVRSDTPFYAHLDGEVIDRPVKKLDLTIIPRGLTVIVP